MDAIRIRHCRLHVLRHGGWSWGADPRRLVEQVTQRLPAWLAEALARQLADCPPDFTIQRLRLRIPIRMSELHDWPSIREERSGSAMVGALAERADKILAAALQDVPRAQPANGNEPARVEAQSAESGKVPAMVVVDTLIAWQRAGDLPRMLAAADGAALRVWARAIVEDLVASGRLRGRLAGSRASLVARIEVLLGDSSTSAASLAQELVQVVAACNASQPDALVGQAAPQSGTDLPRAPPKDLDRSEHPPARLERATHRLSDMRRRVSPARQARRDPVTVESILPFVVMGILSRRSYFEGLRAALICSDLLEQSGCFAASLAYKLSPPPNRGWDRSAATRRLAAAMCGQDEPPANSTMDGFLRGLSTACAPLDASLWPGDRALRKRPGILVEKLDAALWAALDIASSQPLGWFPSVEDILRIADLLPGRLWWLAPGAANSELPAALALRNLHAVALETRPRAAGWQSAGDSLYTNEPLLRRRAAELRRVFDEACEVLAATHSELIDLRPLVLPTRGPARCTAELSIVLAVCSALGELADTLWREPTQPLLALRRFADLGGTVSVEERRVLIRPALGRRFMDLGKHGLLRDIVDVPWWPGRCVEFAGP